MIENKKESYKAPSFTVSSVILESPFMANSDIISPLTTEVQVYDETDGGNLDDDITIGL